MKVLNIYEKFISRIGSQVDKEKKVIFNFVTNLGFTRRTEMFIYFLARNEIEDVDILRLTVDLIKNRKKSFRKISNI